MNRIILFLLVIALGSAQAIQAQDFTSSQHYFNRVYFNPAYAGLDDVFRASINHRQQWPGVMPFMSSNVMLEGQVPRKRPGSSPRVGWGASYFNDIQGDGYLTSHQVKLTSSVIFTNEQYFLSFGLSGSRVWKNVNWNDLVFSDQIHPVLGRLDVASAAKPVDAAFQPFWDFDAGVFFRRSVDNRGKGLIYSFSLAVSHLSEPEESFMGTGTKLPMRLNAGTQWMVPLTKHMYLSPSARYERQAGLQTLNIGTYWFPYVETSRRAVPSIMVGAWVRHQNFNIAQDLNNFVENFDSGVVAIGVQSPYKKKNSNNRKKSWLRTKYRYWQLMVSYDFTVSSLNNSATNGSFEISLVYGFTSQNIKCPIPGQNRNGYLLSLPSTY